MIDMKRNDFFELLLMECDIESPVDENTNLTDIEEWDSLSMITILSLFKAKFNLTLNINDIKNCKNFKEILNMGADYYEK